MLINLLVLQSAMSVETSRHILVTGGTGNIGLALCTQLAKAGYSVLLCARNREKGEAAVKQLSRHGAVRLVLLDVGNKDSVQAAAQSLADVKLFAIVNNAGVMARGASRVALDTNLCGTMSVCRAFIPFLEERGRVVNVSSASGPWFLNKASAQVKAVLMNPGVTWAEIEEQAHALAGKDDYGLSKACINAFTMLLAREYPQFRINACSPGYIPTASAAEKKGTVAIKYLLFDDPPGNGRYYGSDAKRSPLDCNRDPGSPPYDGP